MKLNKKGYMLVEIIVAAVISFSIAYYLLNLTFKFKDKNELVHDSRDLNSIKINVTKNIMNDIAGKDIGFELDSEGNLKGLSNDKRSIEFYVDRNPRKLIIDNNKIEYGYFNSGVFNVKLSSYYVKNIKSNYLQFDVDNVISVEKVTDDNILVSVDIPVSSIYTDEVVHIKLLLQGHKYVKSNVKYILNDGQPDDSLGSFTDILDNSDVVSGSTISVADGEIPLPDVEGENEINITLNKNIVLGSPILVKEGTKVTITGSGTLTSGFNDYLIANQGVLILNGVSLVNNSGGLINNSNGERLEINEGTNITSNATSGTVVLGGNIVMSGGVFNITSNATAVGGENVVMSGGVINAANSKGIYSNGVLTITGGTINKKLSTGESKGAAVHYDGTGTAQIENATINVINAGSNAIWNGKKGTINLKNVIVSNDTHRCVTNDLTGVINADGTKYTCKKFAFANNSSGTINIYSGTITTDGSTSISKIFEKGSGVINDKR